jgi:hypothetical protein
LHFKCESTLWHFLDWGRRPCVRHS